MRNTPPTLTTVDRDEAQPPLVPMTGEELQRAGRRLAALIRQLDDLKRAHKMARDEQKAREDDIIAEIKGVAATIRQQGR